MDDGPVTGSILRERLTDLLEGIVTLEEFDEWFAVNTWDDSNVSFDARQLASRVELVLAEFTSGHWTWSEVQAELMQLAQSIEVAWGGASVRTTGATVGVVMRAVLPERLSGAASIRYEEAFA